MPSSPHHSPSASASTVDLTSTTNESTAPSSFSPPSSHSQLSRDSISPTTPPKGMRRRSSFDILHNIAPDSNLPLPKRESMRPDNTSIREGVPMEFGVAPVNLGHHKRVSSPTRTYSRTSHLI
jgi:hypothetical protein